MPYPKTVIKAHLVSKTDGGMFIWKVCKYEVVNKVSLVILQTCPPQLILVSGGALNPAAASFTDGPFRKVFLYAKWLHL